VSWVVLLGTPPLTSQRRGRGTLVFHISLRLPPRLPSLGGTTWRPTGLNPSPRVACCYISTRTVCSFCYLCRLSGVESGRNRRTGIYSTICEIRYNL